jgi:acyl-coenzyme A thioesterase PaaI-like protein
MTHAKPRPFTLDLRAYLVEIFPEFWKRGDLRVEDIAPMSATLRLIHHPRHLRPGGAISGPTTFGVCDTALFVAILGEIGRVAHAVTTSASINFLRKPAPADLVGHAKLIKLGKRLAVGEVALYSEGESEMVATQREPTRSPRRARLRRLDGVVALLCAGEIFAVSSYRIAEASRFVGESRSRRLTFRASRGRSPPPEIERT